MESPVGRGYWGKTTTCKGHVVKSLSYNDIGGRADEKRNREKHWIIE